MWWPWVHFLHKKKYMCRHFQNGRHIQKCRLLPKSLHHVGSGVKLGTTIHFVGVRKGEGRYESLWFQYTWLIANTKLMLPGLKFLKMQISVWQNWNSFNVVISVLIYQGGHSVLYTYDKLLTGKKICLKDFWPFLIPNLRDQPLLLGITRKVLSFQTCFVLQVFRNS